MVIGILVGYGSYKIVAYKNNRVELYDALPENVTQCVVVVPAMYTTTERIHLKNKIEAEGISVLRMINKTTAAVLAVNPDCLLYNIVHSAGYYRETEKLILTVNVEDGHIEVQLAEVSEGVMEAVAVNDTSYSESRYGNNELIELVHKVITDCIGESQYHGYDVDVTILTGSNMSVVSEAIRKICRDTVVICEEELCCRGAALLTDIYNIDGKVAITEVLPYYIGTRKTIWNEDDNCNIFDVFVRKNSTIPIKCTKKLDISARRIKRTIFIARDGYGNDLTELGTVSYIIPETDKATCEVMESIMVDAEGMVYYQAYIPYIDREYNFMLGVDENMEEPDKEQLSSINNYCMEELQLISKAEEIYAECDENQRKSLNKKISKLEAAIKNGEEQLIRQSAKELEALIAFYSEYETM